MKYYLIAGEASGDLHASHLMQALKEQDGRAEFRFFGGDLMAAVGGTRVKHYSEMAYMGFVPVLLHLPVILKNMRMCKSDIRRWQPDVVILVDYPGFNLNIARYLKSKTTIPAYYYISPKIWAWKEYRIKRIKRDVAEIFSILPFEVPFYEQKHRFSIHYVGNPTVDEVARFKQSYTERSEHFCLANDLQPHHPIIALLAGSRLQEIKDNLPAMIRAVEHFPHYQAVLAGAPAVAPTYYRRFISGTPVRLIENNTYALLTHASAALVTSGTATLETALFNVPQAVCYKTPLPRIIRFAFDHIIRVKYISLVNLIADREVVPELLADRFTTANMVEALQKILPGGTHRERMLADYFEVKQRLGDAVAPENAAKRMVDLLSRRKS